MSNEEQLSQLRSHWQLPAAAQFLLSFKDAFGIEKISTDDLEIALIGYSGTAWISDLFSKLLRALTLNRNISFSNWEEYLNKEYNKRQSEDNPFTLLSVSSFFQLPLERKLLALHHLCEWQLADPERFRLHLNENEKDSSDWRVDPIGWDASGCIYWLFDDNRLYKECPNTVPAKTPKSKAKGRRTSRAISRGDMNLENTEPTWKLIARTSNEWTEVADSFRNPRGLQEKHLASALSQVLPSVLENLEQSEQERKHEEALANRKRSSRILVKELERAEQVRIAETRRESRTEQAESRRSTITARKDEEDRKKRAEARELRLAERERRIQNQDARTSRRDQAVKKEREQPSKKKESTSNRSSRGASTTSTFSVDVENDDENELEEEDDWVFDCICGKYGNNLDDGLPMIACERCNVWQHIACVKEDPSKDPARFNRKEWENVDFYCTRCREKHLSHTETSQSTTPCSEQYDPLAARERLQKEESGVSEEETDYFAKNDVDKHHCSSISSSASSHSATSRKISDEPVMIKRELLEDHSETHVSNVKKIKLFSSSTVTDGRPPVPVTRQCAQPSDPVQALGKSDSTASNAYSKSFIPDSIPVSMNQQSSTRIKLVDHSSLVERSVSNSSLANRSYPRGTPYPSTQTGANPMILPTQPTYQGHPYPPSSLSSLPPSCIPPIPVTYAHSTFSPSVSHPLHHPPTHHPNSMPVGYGIPLLDPAYHTSASSLYSPMEAMDHPQHNYQQSPGASYPSSLPPAHPSSNTPYPIAHVISQYDSVAHGVYPSSVHYPAPSNGFLPNNERLPPSQPIPGQIHPLHPVPAPYSDGGRSQLPGGIPFHHQVPPRG